MGKVSAKHGWCVLFGLFFFSRANGQKNGGTLAVNPSVAVKSENALKHRDLLPAQTPVAFTHLIDSDKKKKKKKCDEKAIICSNRGLFSSFLSKAFNCVSNSFCTFGSSLPQQCHSQKEIMFPTDFGGQINHFLGPQVQTSNKLGCRRQKQNANPFWNDLPFNSIVTGWFINVRVQFCFYLCFTRLSINVSKKANNLQMKTFSQTLDNLAAMLLVMCVCVCVTKLSACGLDSPRRQLPF